MFTFVNVVFRSAARKSRANLKDEVSSFVIADRTDMDAFHDIFDWFLIGVFCRFDILI